MSELQKQPQYIKMVHDDDVATMIRGMRESMGLARMKKIENKRPASGGKRASKTTAANQEMTDDLAALAASFGMELS